MSRDTLSDVLRTVRLRGALFYYLDGTSPWTAEVPPAPEIIPGIMPGAEHLIEFHGVVEGACWGGVAGEEPVRLVERDIILFPHGDPHVMSSAPGLRPPRVDKSVYFAPRPPQLPYALSLNGSEVTTAPRRRWRADTVLVCGFWAGLRPFSRPGGAPRVLRRPGATLGADSWIASFLRAAV
jgi:hypothetical protein